MEVDRPRWLLPRLAVERWLLDRWLLDRCETPRFIERFEDILDLEEKDLDEARCRLLEDPPRRFWAEASMAIPPNNNANRAVAMSVRFMIQVSRGSLGKALFGPVDSGLLFC